MLLMQKLTVQSTGTVASPHDDPDGQHITTDWRVGGCCQSEPDPPPASLVTERHFKIRKPSKRDADMALKSLMSWGVVPKYGYMTKEVAASSDNKVHQW